MSSEDRRLVEVDGVTYIVEADAQLVRVVPAVREELYLLDADGLHRLTRDGEIEIPTDLQPDLIRILFDTST